MRAKKNSDYQEMFLGGRMREKRKQGKGFFGNSQARFSGMAGADEGIDMSYRGRGFLGLGRGKGSALRREKRQLKRAARRGELGEGGQDRLDYLRSVQKDRAKKAVGAGALAAGAALGGAALAGKLGTKGLFKGGLKGVFKGGAKGAGKTAGKEAGKGGFKDLLKKEGKRFLSRQLQGGGGRQQTQPMPQYQPMPQMMPQAMPQAMPTEDRSLQTVDMYGENGTMIKRYRKGGLVGDQHKLDKNKDGKISGADFKMMSNGGVMKYRAGGMMPKYEDGGPVIEDVSDLLTALAGVKTPEDYTAAEFAEVRGTARMGDQEARKPAGGALDRDIAQPMKFEVRKYGSDSPSRAYERFELQDVQLGGMDEETGIMMPNVLTLPPEIMDMVEEGKIDRKDIMQALGQSYSRADDQGFRTLPEIIRGKEEEKEDFTPPRPSGGKKRKVPQFRLPQLPYMTSPKYAGGRRPLFTPGQLGRVGRGG